MSVNAVEAYLVQMVNGLTTPYTTQPLQAWTQPPVPSYGSAGDYMSPQLFVLNALGDGKRQTGGGANVGAGRSVAGYFLHRHTVQMFLGWAFLPNGSEPNAATNRAFKNLVDVIFTTVQCSQIPITVTDPDTQNQTQLLAVGEEIAWRIMPPENLGEAGQEFLLYQAQLSVIVEEKVQYSTFLTTSDQEVFFEDADMPVEVVMG